MTVFKCRDKQLVFGSRTLCMGILNVTPDSFSDGGVNIDSSDAFVNSMKMVEAGVDVIDIGGESTRPGYTEISVDEELSRIIPVIKRLTESSDVVISVDTYKSEVAREALEAGCHIINDITGFKGDSRMAEVVKAYDAGCVLMFNLRNEKSTSEDITRMAVDSLGDSIRIAKNAGIDDNRIILDPGIGFGTSRSQDLTLIKDLNELSMSGKYPILLALSRKRIAGELLGRESIPSDRDYISIGLGLAGVRNGAGMLRVHNVPGTIDALKGFDGVIYG